ncbi:MAG: nuclear transport factor 2 family protein [Vicinamibacterales bacterium]
MWPRRLLRIAIVLGTALVSLPGGGARVVELAWARQAPPAAAAPNLTAIVTEWIDRWNRLDGSPETARRFAELYAADAMHVTGPSPDQRGTATFRGADAIRDMAADYGRTHEKIAFRLEVETANEQAQQLLHLTEGPWHGPALGFQLVAVATERSTGKRYVTPGAAFLQIAGDKIRRARVYFASGERSEVEPDQRRRPGG